MADNTTRASRSYGTENEIGGHQFDEDPLVELARIVSDDGSFFQSPPEKPARSAQSGSAINPFSADLEAELLEQFEASFSGEAEGTADNTYPADRQAAPEAEVESEFADYAAGDSQALGTQPTGEEAQSGDATSTDYGSSDLYSAVERGDALAGRQSDPVSATPSDMFDELADSLAMASGGQTSETAAPETAGSEPNDQPDSSFSEAEFSQALAGGRPLSLHEDFTPEFGVEAYGRDPELPHDEAVGDDRGDGQSEYAAPAYEMQDSDADYGYEEMAMPPPAASRGGARKGLIAVAGVVAVVVLGGGVAAYIGKLRPADSSTPVPVIKAETGDIKVMADTTESSGAQPSVLDQLADQQPKSEEKLIDRIEEPRQIARVVLPGAESENTTQLAKPVGQEADKPADSAIDSTGKTIDRVMQDTGEPPVAQKVDPIGPRKVRTVVVKPDGSIVSSAGTETDVPAPPAPEPMAVASAEATPPPEPMPVRTTEIRTAPEAGGAPDGSANAGDGIQPSSPPLQVANTEPAAPLAGSADTVAPEATLSGAIPKAKPANIPSIVAAPSSSRQAARSPQRSASQPVNLLAAPAAADSPSVTASTTPAQSGYVIQVTSQRSAEQARASFADMQRRYRSVLGGFQPNIERADLGEKGIYYRARIGPMANREAALRLCEQLKSAGGSCFVTR